MTSGGSAGLGGPPAPARPALGGRPPLRPPSGGAAFGREEGSSPPVGGAPRLPDRVSCQYETGSGGEGGRTKRSSCDGGETDRGAVLRWPRTMGIAVRVSARTEPGGAAMLKHRGFPSRLPGSDLQFTIRRAATEGATPLKARERYADRRPIDRQADAAFLAALFDSIRRGAVRARQPRRRAARLAARARGGAGRGGVRPGRLRGAAQDRRRAGAARRSRRSSRAVEALRRGPAPGRTTKGDSDAEARARWPASPACCSPAAARPGAAGGDRRGRRRARRRGDRRRAAGRGGHRRRHRRAGALMTDGRPRVSRPPDNQGGRDMTKTTTLAAGARGAGAARGLRRGRRTRSPPTRWPTARAASTR